ncbi:MAG: 2,3-bisphosphoglycerate-independent phosphoglycerate mutase [Firmicutes bacterium]|nr:2,3-bisphosphoglycerate-independent phosphoglycerate mutase [Bacillota bacterium]MDY3658737.1 2,3-bisphosphoglycerate-independent phosphoglycerate mutase [Eubacteriales bacterium]
MITLLILDGYGERKESEGNAILGNSPKIELLKKNYPSCLLDASGQEVGLVKGQMGNSETGHLNLGSGRVVFQDLSRINASIESKEFFKNEVLKDASNHAKTNKSNVHIMGLLSDGGVHSTVEHAKAVVLALKKNGIKKVYFHAFLDGRDTPIDSGIGYVEEMQNFLNKEKMGEIISVSGRVYAMDREKRFDRVQRVYNMMTGISDYGFQKTNDLKREISECYKKQIFDEFIPPFKLFDSPNIESGDVIISYNFRTDRMRELVSSLSQKNFNEFSRADLDNLFVVTMTEYDKSFKNVNLIFEPEKIKNCLSEVLSKNKLKQFRVAETTKYAHITFFFNGGTEKPFDGEERMLIESYNVQNFSCVPKMKAGEITKEAIKKIKSKEYDFVLINLSNADMIGHTGNFKATKKAIRYVDKCAYKIAMATLHAGGDAIITADHGNAEKMIENGKILTSHTLSKVPLILVSKKLKNVSLKNGKLANVSPTILDIFGIKKPKEMSENSLIF